MKKKNIPVAKEGYPFIFFTALVTLVVAILQYELLTFFSLVVCGLVLNFFRDPERVVPVAPEVLVAPADGKVIIVDKIFDDKFLHDQVYKVSIFMNVFNVHVNRCPFPGKIQAIQYTPGKFYSADSARGALQNEHCALIMEVANEKKIAFVQIAGLIARRIVCWAEPGDFLERGERFGLIRFGSRVDLYLPLDANLEVIVGQKVKAGESVICTLPS